MSDIVLVRKILTPLSAIGRMDVFGTKIWTLEDPVRDEKIYGVTAIPAGRYELKLRNEGTKTKKYQDRYPDMHKGMIWLQDVPDYEWVYIHTGNKPEHTDGCILTGMSHGEDVVHSSRDAYRLVYPMIVGAINADGCWLEIKDA